MRKFTFVILLGESSVFGQSNKVEFNLPPHHLKTVEFLLARVPLVDSDLEARRILINDAARDLLWPSFFEELPAYSTEGRGGLIEGPSKVTFS